MTLTLPVTVEVALEAAKTFGRFVQHKGLPERGGLLLGEIHPGEGKLVVLKASEPAPGDKGTACTWERDGDASNEAIRLAWEESGGTINYIGEWHTHPTDHPSPSRRDCRTMERLLATGSLPADALLLVIIGRKSIWAGIWSSDGCSRVNINRV